MSPSARPSSRRAALLRTLIGGAIGITAAAVPNAAAQTSAPLAELETLGTGTSGAAGVPELVVLRRVALDQPGAGLRLLHGAPHAPAQIVFSLAVGPAPLPGYGAQLWPGTPFTRWTTTLDAQGASPVFASGPAVTPPVLAGLDLYLQGLVLDAAARGGAAFTAGVRVHVGVGSAAAALFPFARFEVVPDGAYSAQSILAAGDLDGNGRPDVVVAAGNGAKASLCVLRQLTDGTLAPPLVTPLAGVTVKDLALADFDADGRLDAVVATPGTTTGTIVVLPGLGDGTFGPLQLFPTLAPVKVLAAGDVSGDGLPDVIAPGWTANSVGILRASPDGGFDPILLVSAPSTEFAVGVSLTDADGDGLTDILVAERDQFLPAVGAALQVLRGLGGGAFAPPTSTSFDFPVAVASAVGDLDGDGAPDAAIGGGNASPAVLALLNDGSGTFTVATKVSDPAAIPGVDDLAIADMDGDGANEVLVGGLPFLGVQSVAVLALAGGQLVPQPPLPVFTTVVVPVDMDGDGALDLPALQGDGKSWYVQVIRGAGDGTVVETPLLPDFVALQTETADLDGDGDLDLVGALVEGELAVVLGDGRGHFGAAAAVDAGGAVRRFALGDLDGDGVTDIVATLSSPAGLVVLAGLGDGSFGAPTGYAAITPQDVQVADVTLDGRPDVIVTGGAAGLAVYPALADGSLGAPVPTASVQTLKPCRVGDLDGDGDLDVVAQGNDLIVFRGTGTPAFEAGVVIPHTGAAQAADEPLALGDLDGDGDLDMVATKDIAGVSMLCNDGAGNFTEAPGTILVYPFGGLTIADVNADGATDVVGGFIALGFGDGSFAAWQSGSAYGTGGDFDGDGDLDFCAYGRLFFNALY